ncbi:Cuticle Protein CPCFC 1 [Frankliniella occidentalis]|uniref:Cuticle protein 1-like n=1 Tax=Frankliniella occidentalis TaxID=133901 RepID=A0A6J1S5K2_FRAOC|nr:cuticle protein 1-like [Frankliniella occidentalis]XP_052119747.1 cuticle protein 1-like [Frankliniella occidentalis]KAE8750966.1 Cuticle Protein CPCFC 1 [Frankliniella occidentalis]
MISKLVVLAAAVAVVASQAAQYPAGVSPHLCPNYPHCDNALLALHAQGAANAPVHAAAYAPAPNYNNYNPAPNYNNYNPAPAYNPYNAAPAGVPAAAQYPAGVSPASCPNYPYCSGHIGAPGPVAAPPLPGFSSRQYPDGISPSTCPNYPYCH